MEFLLPKIEQIVKEFFSRMNLDGTKVEDINLNGETVSVKIKSNDPQILIGEKGYVLFNTQRLLRIILKKKLEIDKFYLDLDINDYKKKKIEYLKEIARTAAEEVILTKKEKVLDPMPPYERRIIHLELADRPNVTTESIGEEPERRVVVKLYP